MSAGKRTGVRPAAQNAHYDSVSDTDTDTDSDSDTDSDTDSDSDTDIETDTGSDNTFKMPTATTAPSALEVDSFYQAYCLNKGYIPRDNFTERFLTYHHGKDWEKDVRSWADQDAKSDKLKAQHTQKRQHNSIQNFTPSDTDWDDLANQIKEKEEREMRNHS